MTGRAGSTVSDREQQTIGASAALIAAIAILGAAIYSPLAITADATPTVQALQASCIQDAMARGLSGEALKTYVQSCVESERAIPMLDQKPRSLESPAC